MAGDWIPMRLDLAEDPAVILIAQATGLDEYGVIGRLHRLWSWANRQLRDGCADVALEFADRLVCAPGFAQAMVDAGWLSRTETGLKFTNYDRWNSKSAKRRLLAARRMLRSRCANVARPAQQKRNQRREEKRRVDKNPPTPPFVSDQFQKAWSDWESHRREKGETIKPTTMKAQFDYLAKLGETEAVRILRHSTLMGYTGLYPPKDSGGSGSPGRSAPETDDEAEFRRRESARVKREDLERKAQVAKEAAERNDDPAPF